MIDLKYKLPEREPVSVFFPQDHLEKLLVH